MPALPYSKKRYYLSGIDWLIGTINDYMLSSTHAGNHSTLVLELSKTISKDDLCCSLEKIYSFLPVLSGMTARDLINLAPYWKVPSGSSNNYDIEEFELCSEGNFDEELIAVLNRPFSSSKTYLSFTLLNSQSKKNLLMTFDHRILDARGAELFLDLLSSRTDEELIFRISEIKTTDSPHLKEWGEKFAAGRTVQRKIIAFSKEGCFSNSKYNMKNLPASKKANLKPAFGHFSKSETSTILKDAEGKAGFMMETPFLLSLTALAFHEITNYGKSAKYFVPVPIDMRTKGEEAKRTFFNHLSFLFFYFEITPETTVDDLICEIRKQFFSQIEEGFPEEMIKAAYPGRIFPFLLLKWAMKLPFDAKNCSFVFSNVGTSSFNNDNILGSKVNNIHHMPRIPTPPGTGIFFNRFDDKMNLTVVSDQNVTDDNFGEELKSRIVDKII